MRYIINLLYRLHLCNFYYTNEFDAFFQECNKKYFNEELDLIPIKITRKKDCTFWGQYRFTYNLKNHTKKNPYIMIHIDTVNKGNKFFKSVLVHEMVHYYCSVKHWPSPVKFYKIDKKLEELDIDDTDFRKKLNRIYDSINGFNGGHDNYFMRICHILNKKFPELELKAKYLGNIL